MASLGSRSTPPERPESYQPASRRVCVPPPSILQGLRDAGFTDVDRYVELGIFSEYRARKPG